MKQDSSKKQYPPNDIEHNVLLTRRVGPACKTRPREAAHAQNASVSSKRKASLGDESDPIIVEDSDGDSVSMLTASSKEALTTLTATTSPSTNNAVPARSVKERSGSTKAIMLIDLCSSDEEEDRNTVAPPCDENRDPMNSTECPITKSSPRKSTPNHKLSTKSYVHSATSSDDRLPNNILNEDRNCTHKCRTGVLNEYAHLSPILRPAP